jgi:membrane dipeptidase
MVGSLVWDNHACMPLDSGCPVMDQLRGCRLAGIDVVCLNVASGDQTASDATRMLAAFRSWLAQRPDEFMLVATAGDARRAHAAGKLGVCFDIEGMSALDGNLDMVRLFYDLGVRWMLTAYNHRNAAGGGCLDADDGGLSAFGRAVVAAMNRVGMVVCGSHAGYRTARELIDVSAAPVIFSHSNPRAVWDTPRNIPDELMLACARRGGVIGLNGIGAFLGANDIRTETFVRHVEYALSLIGEDHVGIALDYCFGFETDMMEFLAQYPELFPSGDGYLRDGLKMIAPWQLTEVARTLSARGLGSAALAKLFGGNHLRIAETVWR